MTKDSRTTPAAKEFEEDHGVFDYKDFFNDFFMGVVRNPRLFHGILKTPFDLKRFWNARPGLTGWVILNISYLAAWLPTMGLATVNWCPEHPSKRLLDRCYGLQLL